MFFSGDNSDRIYDYLGQAFIRPELLLKRIINMKTNKELIQRLTYIMWAIWGVMFAIVWKPAGIIWFLICLSDWIDKSSTKGKKKK